LNVGDVQLLAVSGASSSQFGTPAAGARVETDFKILVKNEISWGKKKMMKFQLMPVGSDCFDDV
jgi:hypothetical protein